jgi:hypothetical protein
MNNSRKMQRPQEASQPKFWCVRYQDWLSLDEITYRKMQDAAKNSSQS